MLRFIYRSLLRLHPAGFRRRFSEEMLSIFDQVDERRAAARLVADAFISLCRQWSLRSEYWEDKQTEPAHSADGVPVFYTIPNFAPRTSALINGAIVTLLIFCGVCLALKYNWEHPVYLRFSGVRFEFRNDDLQPAISPAFAEEGIPVRVDRPAGPARAASAGHPPAPMSRAAQPSTDGSAISQPAVVALPANVQPQVTPVGAIRYYSPRQIDVSNSGPAQRKDPFATQLFIARFYSAHRDYPKAVAHYRLALQIRQDDPDATFELAQSLEKSGSTAEAQSAYRAYLQSAPNGRFAEQSKAALHRIEMSASR